MRIRLMIDVEHSDDVADLAALTQEQPAVQVVRPDHQRMTKELLFNGRFIGAEPVAGVGE